MINITKKILIVDDDRDFVEILYARLSSFGYEIITAGDGVEGLEKVRSSTPDLIILDIMMPRMDGYDLCRLLKFDEKYKAIPVIMLTAKSQDIDRVMGNKVGADEYITKPFEIKDLIGKVRKHLGEEL